MRRNYLKILLQVVFTIVYKYSSFLSKFKLLNYTNNDVVNAGYKNLQNVARSDAP